MIPSMMGPDSSPGVLADRSTVEMMIRAVIEVAARNRVLMVPTRCDDIVAMGNANFIVRTPLWGWMTWCGINQAHRVVVYNSWLDVKPVRPLHLYPFVLLHEVAHVVADEDLNSVDEVSSGMLWFEHAVMKSWPQQWRAETIWEDWMHDYGLDNGAYWGYATTQQREVSLELSRLGAERRNFAV